MRPKNIPKLKKKLYENTPAKNNTFFTNVCIVFGGFWGHFESQNALKNRMKFWTRFWMPKKGGGPIFWGRPGGMRGGPGEDPPPPFGGAGRD